MSFWRRIGQAFEDAASSLTSSLTDPERQQLRDAQRAFAEHRYDTCVDLAGPLSKQHQDHAGILRLLGMAYIGLQRFDDAIETLERALEIDKTDASVLAAIASAHLEKSQYDVALLRARQALSLSKKSEQHARLLGICGEAAFHLGRYRQASYHLNRARETDLASFATELETLLLRSYVLLKMYDAADTVLQRLEPRQDLATLRLIVERHRRPQAAAATALELLQQDQATDIDSAVDTLVACGTSEQLKAALELPACEPPQYRALLLERLGSLDEAVAQLERALVASSEGRETLARILLRLQVLTHRLTAGSISDALKPTLSVLGEASLPAHEPSKAWTNVLAALLACETRDFASCLERLARTSAEALFEPVQPAMIAAVADARLAELVEMISEPAKLGMAELAQTLRDAQALLPANAALHDHLQRASWDRIQTALAEPLVVAVVGEFSAGKSTLINTLIGESLLPMGVTPTTASLHVLRYSPEPTAAMVYTDELEEPVDWSGLSERLKQANKAPEQHAALSRVELGLPANILRKIVLVDTPGVNSPVAAHQEVTSAFLSQADAIIWVFSALQAGSASQAEMIGHATRHAAKSIAVVNKADRVSEQELSQIEAHLRESFASTFGRFYSVSAKVALTATTPDEMTSSGIGKLFDGLDREFFRQTKRLKRERLLGSLDRALEATETDLGRDNDALATELNAVDTASIDSPAFADAARPLADRLREQIDDLVSWICPTVGLSEQPLVHPGERIFVGDTLREWLFSTLQWSHQQLRDNAQPSAHSDIDRAYDQVQAYCSGWLDASIDRRDLAEACADQQRLRRWLETEIPAIASTLRQALKTAAEAQRDRQTSAQRSKWLSLKAEMIAHTSARQPLVRAMRKAVGHLRDLA